MMMRRVICSLRLCWGRGGSGAGEERSVPFLLFCVMYSGWDWMGFN